MGILQVDNAAHRWEELPSAYGGAKEYISAGAAAADIDGDGHDDVVISGVDDRDGSFFYAVSYNMELDGGSDEFTGMLEVPVGFPEESAGSGVALADINKNGKMDIVCMAVESRSGADRFVYTIGYDLDSNARAKEWTSLMIGPTLGHKNQGGGLSVADLDGNGKFEFVMMAIDNPDGANHFRYTIRWNFDPNAADAYEYNSDEWSALRATGNIGHHNQGGGVEVVNLDGDSKPDLLFTCMDNPD